MPNIATFVQWAMQRRAWVTVPALFAASLWISLLIVSEAGLTGKLAEYCTVLGSLALLGALALLSARIPWLRRAFELVAGDPDGPW